MGDATDKLSWQGVIFDLDGTLVDSAVDLANAVNVTLVELGFPPHDLNDIIAFVGDGALRLLERALPESARGQARAALPVFLSRYGEHLLDHTRAYPGIDDLLHAMNDRRLAIATNKPVGLARGIVEGLGWQRHFRVVLGGDSLPIKKPDPKMLLAVCEQLELTPAACIMVGDSPHDVMSGRAAGLATCAVTWGYRSRAELDEHRPDFYVHNVSELQALLARR
jgi:phosphoglycolate phosphatase